MVIFRYGLVRAGVPFVLLAHTCHVADNLQVAATCGAEKLESKSSCVELKANKIQEKNRPERPATTNRENPARNRKY
jgi:hypothetical protein